MVHAYYTVVLNRDYPLREQDVQAAASHIEDEEDSKMMDAVRPGDVVLLSGSQTIL